MSATLTTERSLIDELLDEQRRLSAVEHFAQWHESNDDRARHRYRNLIPLSSPGPGEQYAFAVDLDKCSGCKACVCACHSLNGLDENEMWRTTGLLVGMRSGSALPSSVPTTPYLQTITSACHHCVDPGCLNGCPVLAYEKDPVTGIVRHLDDQCIGCQYCVLKCPYDVPKYSPAKGIVRKCDLCHNRLAAGEAPACVQACPHEAIRIEVVSQAEITAGHRPSAARLEDSFERSNRFLPDTADPAITLPATRYTSLKGVPRDARAANTLALRLESGHWPLVIMLVLTQLAAGIHILLACLLAGGLEESLPVLALSAMAALLAGMTASVAHLGRPLKAWRAFLGWRRSWMSREILALSAYAAAAAGLVWRPGDIRIALFTALIATVSVVCSAMIYVDTRRAAWSAQQVFGRFFGTTLRLGTAAGAVWAGWLAPSLTLPMTLLAVVVGSAVFGWECAVWFRAGRDPRDPLHLATATLMQLLRLPVIARMMLFAGTTLFFVASLAPGAQAGAVWATVAFTMAMLSAVLERYTFFAACPAPRMPGGVVA